MTSKQATFSSMLEQERKDWEASIRQRIENLEQQYRDVPKRFMHGDCITAERSAIRARIDELKESLTA